MRELNIAWFISFSFVTGIVLGFEHISAESPEEDPDDGIIWMIVIHLPFFRICFGQCELTDEEEQEA